jgi:hypothetical protein
MRWFEDVKKDIRETKIERWPHKAVDREEWASAVKEAKAVRGQHSQGMSN